MRRSGNLLRILCAAVCFFPAACASHPARRGDAPPAREAAAEPALNEVLNAAALGSGVYIGISGRRFFRDEERNYAKLHIAHQIAMNQKCVVDYGYISIEGSPADDRAVYDSNIAWDDTMIDAIVERIVILAEHRLPDCTVLAARDAGMTGGAVNAVTRTGAERPAWVRSLPEIEGYYTGVGVADRYSEWYKSVLAADVEAAQTIAKTKNAYIRGFTNDSVTEDAAEPVSGTVMLLQAELYGLRILDRWIEPSGVCYSLAAARKE